MRLRPRRQKTKRAGGEPKRAGRSVAKKATHGAQASRATATEPKGPRVCAWCRVPLTTVRGRFCSRRCRQVAFRLRHRPNAIEVIDATAAPGRTRRRPVRLGYLDISSAGAKVPRRLTNDLRGLDGWALSASPLALRELLTRLGAPRRGAGGAATVCAWSSPQPADAEPAGLRSSWEAVIVRSPRKPQAGVPDSLFGGYRGDRSERQSSFGAWVIGLLGAMPGDQLVDLTGPDGVVARAWRELGGAAVEKVIAPRRRRRRPPPGGQIVTPTDPPEPPADPGPPPPPEAGN